ncbi:hypothetical protein Taro_026746 [Colocasia esculenta]|uniref:Uncharacterized protein n=1 Tax=Colocasia esculenta TaxID=4460 RepID=A0A843VKH7_COLES|nr:hypothetical protein [Colocasia esculenta]
MRREGRQHGLVLTVEPAPCPQPTLRRGRLLVDASNSPPTTAFRTRVPTRPTNHSKYTGKASAGVRQQPFSKSKDKSKGARKLRALDIGLNPQLASWRVTGGSGDRWGLLAIRGASASAAAVYLSGYPLDGEEGTPWGCPLYDEQRWVDEDMEGGGGEEETKEVSWGAIVTSVTGGEEEGGGEMEQGELADDSSAGDAQEEEEDLGFCEVWYVWEYLDEEDWCVVGEMEI